MLALTRTGVLWAGALASTVSDFSSLCVGLSNWNWGRKGPWSKFLSHYWVGAQNWWRTWDEGRDLIKNRSSRHYYLLQKWVVLNDYVTRGFLILTFKCVFPSLSIRKCTTHIRKPDHASQRASLLYSINDYCIFLFEHQFH